MSERRLQQVGRDALCATLEAAGPNAPTLCEGWRAIDLAAHMVVREGDPWTAPVIICGTFNGIIARMTARERAGGFERLVRRLRGGPPWLFRSTPLTVRLNTVEDWIHREDVRRANTDAVETPDPELAEVLWRGIRSTGVAAALRLHDVGMDAVAPDGRRLSVKRGRQVVEVVGEPGEVLLYVTGRGAVAEVELRGPADAVDHVRATRLHL